MRNLMSRVAAFFWGVIEFRTDFTRSYDYPLIETYDAGRDLAHKLTFRIWDRAA